MFAAARVCLLVPVNTTLEAVLNNNRFIFSAASHREPSSHALCAEITHIQLQHREKCNTGPTVLMTQAAQRDAQRLFVQAAATDDAQAEACLAGL